jgi:hypothetical protein
MAKGLMGHDLELKEQIVHGLLIFLHHFLRLMGLKRVQAGPPEIFQGNGLVVIDAMENLHRAPSLANLFGLGSVNVTMF